MSEVKEIKEEDWRGLLALTLLVGTFLVVIVGALTGNMTLIGEILKVMGGPILLVLYWYFKSKETS